MYYVVDYVAISREQTGNSQVHPSTLTPTTSPPNTHMPSTLQMGHITLPVSSAGQGRGKKVKIEARYTVK